VVIVRLPRMVLNINPPMSQIDLTDRSRQKSKLHHEFALKLQKELLKDYSAGEKLVYPRAVPSKPVEVSVIPEKIDIVL